jgi:hypothetical protein
MSNFRRKDIRRQFFIKSQNEYPNPATVVTEAQRQNQVKTNAQMSNSFGL